MHFGIMGWFIISLIAVVLTSGVGAAAAYLNTTSSVGGNVVGLLTEIPGPFMRGFEEGRDAGAGEMERDGGRNGGNTGPLWGGGNQQSRNGGNR